METSDRLIFTTIKTLNGYFIKLDGDQHQFRDVFNYYYDEMQANKTYNNKWGIIPYICNNGIEVRVTKRVTQQNINYRYILRDDTMVSDKIPLELSMVTVVDGSNCDGNIWKDEYKHLRSLYIEISDPQPDIYEPMESEFNLLLEIENISYPPEIKYKIKEWTPEYSRGGKQDVNYTNADIKHRELDSIIFPDLIKHETPCTISSEQLFQIIRWHIKQNIDTKVARITSDYDFHFEVVKVIDLSEPYELEYKYTPPRKRKPIVSTKYVTNRTSKCIEITHQKDKWKDAAIIEPICANTEAELKQKIDHVLSDLIKEVNAPLLDCPTCKGSGVILNSGVN